MPWLIGLEIESSLLIKICPGQERDICMYIYTNIPSAGNGYKLTCNSLALSLSLTLGLPSPLLLHSFATMHTYWYEPSSSM